MASPITITVEGSGLAGSDAPSVDDLVVQLQEIIALLKELDSAVADDSQESIVWRVTDAHKNSPLSFEVTPYPKAHAINVDNRAAEVVRIAANGLQEIGRDGPRPRYFSNRILERTQRFLGQFSSSMAKTTVDFSNYDNAPNLEINRDTATQLTKRIHALSIPAPSMHKELGSVEGYINKVELDGHGRPIVWLRSRLDGEVVKCLSSGSSLDRIGHLEVAKVLSGLRVRFFGLMHFRDLTHINYMDVERVLVFDNDRDLPDVEDIISPNFTNGIEAVTYLELIRRDS